jgi:hypothetical protein
MILEAGMIAVPSAPNWEEGIVSIENFHGIQLVAFGSGRQVVILRKDTMAAVHVSHELASHVRAVCWGGTDGITDETGSANRDSSAGAKQVNEERDSLRMGTLAVSMEHNVLVLIALYNPSYCGNPALIPWSWIPAYSLESCSVVKLAWCPLSNFLVTCSHSSLCGWKIPLPRDCENSKRGKTGKDQENSRPLTIISKPVWEIARLPSLSKIEFESTPVSNLSFTCDGVSSVIFKICFCRFLKVSTLAASAVVLREKGRLFPALRIGASATVYYQHAWSLVIIWCRSRTNTSKKSHRRICP